MIKSKVIGDSTYECYYYEIENYFINLLNNNNSLKEEYLEYSKNYHYFNGLIDFFIIEKNYQIDNVLGKENYTIKKSHDHIILIFNNNAIYRFCNSDDITLDIKPLSYDLNNIDTCICDDTGHSISLGTMNVHNDLAYLYLINKGINDEELVNKYNEYKNVYLKEEYYLIDKCGFITMGVEPDNHIALMNSDSIYYKNEDYLSYLASCNFIDNNFITDMNINNKLKGF